MSLLPQLDKDGRWPWSFCLPLHAALCLAVWALILWVATNV